VIEDAVTHETFHEESTTVASSSHCPVTQRDMMLETAGKASHRQRGDLFRG
jgi:hypothetical protein